MNKYLIKLADHLDKKGLHKEADYIDWIIKNAKENMDIPTPYDFAERLKKATLGHFVVTKENTEFHLQTPFLKTLEFLGGLGTNEQDIYDIFEEIKVLEAKNKNFKLKNVAMNFKELTGKSLFDVLEDELQLNEIKWLHTYYPAAMAKLKKYKEEDGY